MKKILLIALFCVMPHVALGGMGAPGMPISENIGGLELEKRAAEALSSALSSTAEKGAERLSSISCPIPEKYRMPLAVGGVAIAGCVAAYKWRQASNLAQTLAQMQETERARAETAKQQAFAQKVARVNGELAKFTTNATEGGNYFYNSDNGKGFNGWFEQQQEYIVAMISNPEFLKQALEPHGALATRDTFAPFGIQIQGEQYQQNIYTFSIDTPKSAKAALDLKQRQAGTSEPATTNESTPPLTGQALKEATQTLNPPLVLTLVKTVGQNQPETFDNLLFAHTNSPEKPYEIRIYEEIISELPKPGWFAGWFTRNKTAPTPAATSAPGQQPQIPTSPPAAETKSWLQRLAFWK